MDNPAKNWKLIVGLGNPGSQYAKTYHNAGEMAVRMIAGEGTDFQKPFSIWNGKPFSYIKKEGVVIMVPMTYMNESGKAVTSAIRHFGIQPSEMAVFHDDSDLPLGTYKIEFGRGSAGHNGIKSIIDHLGTQDFWRVRIGVRSDDEQGRAGDFVLKKIPPHDMERLNEALSHIKVLNLE